MSKKDEALKLALEANTALREWISAVPKDTPLPAMPGIDGDWLDEVDATIREALAEQPASKPWVCLTNQELIDLTSAHSGAALYCAIEAKLKEKNA